MTEAPDYYTLIIRNLTNEEAEMASSLAFDEGASGTEENLAFIQKGREYEPETLSKERTDLKIYFSQRPSARFFENLKAHCGSVEWELVGEKNRDWLAEWKKGFTPFALAGDVWIVPSWCEVPSEASSVIRMDPGMAFGTGTHETTRLAAGFLVDYAKASTLLDVGTGTGVLALVAEILGFQKIIANDIDPEARRVSRENVRDNKSRCVSVVDEPLEKISGSFHWVVANIIDGVLVRLQTELKSRVAPRGHLLLTGVLGEREALFREEFLFDGFKILERRSLGEWVGYLLQRV